MDTGNKTKVAKNTGYHGGYPIGSVDYVPKSFKRRGAFIRYITSGAIIWLLKSDIKAHYKQLKKENIKCVKR